jgi:hypothetical protein
MLYQGLVIFIADLPDMAITIRVGLHAREGAEGQEGYHKSDFFPGRGYEGIRSR